MRELILVRHGETDWNRDARLQGWTDIPLNEAGRSQARRLAERLAGRRWDAIYTSDLQRARETAAIVADGAGVRPVASAAWREIKFGELEGIAGEEKERRFVKALKTATEAEPLVPDAESYREFRGRIVADYERMTAAHPDGSVLLVSHGGTIRALICHVIGLDPRRARHLSLWANTSLSRIYFGGGHPQLTLLNDISHLGGALSPTELG